MKLPSLALPVAACAALLTSACIIHVDADGVNSGFCWNDEAVRHGSGNRITETRTVAGFHAIELRGAADVRARIGAEQKLDVTADDNLLEYVRTEVRNGTLVIEMERGRYSFDRRLTIDVTVPALDGLAVSGSGDIELADLDGARLSIGVSGSGDVKATGRVDTLDVALSGSGDLDLSKLDTRTARVQISGSGDVNIQASEQLDANVSGSGDIRYSGNARVNTQVSGSGSISRR